MDPQTRWTRTRALCRIATLAGLSLSVTVSGCGLDSPEESSEQAALDESMATGKLDIAPEKAKAMEDWARQHPGDIAPRNAPCGSTGENLDHAIHADAPAGDFGVNQRSGSSTNCPILGVLQPTDDAEYFCWTLSDGVTWTYLRNVRTGVRGWSLDSLLDGNGASGPSRCRRFP